MADLIVYFSGHIMGKAGSPLKAGDDDMTDKLKGVLGGAKFAGWVGSSDSRSVVVPAAEFVKKNYDADSKLIVYGYSMGGFNAMYLCDELAADPPGMPELYLVDLLITVDAAAWQMSGKMPRNIARNVRANLNYYQTKGTLSKDSHGGPNTALGPRTSVMNIPMEEADHASIREKSMDNCIEAMRRILTPLKPKGLEVERVSRAY